MPELLPNLPTFCQLACRISAIAGQFACQYGSHEVTGGTSRAMACCFTCDSTRHCMPMRCMHDDPPRVRPRIMQQAIRHKASSHIPVNPLLYQARASRVWYARFVAMAYPFACLLSHTSTILRPTDPPKRSSPRCRDSRGVCVSVSCGHASCSRPSDTRLPHTNLHNPSSPPGSSIQTLACKM